MRVKILSTDGLSVRFDSAYGEGFGRWMEGVPVVGNEYHVEFDIDSPLRIGENLRITKEEKARININQKDLIIVAKVDNAFDDGSASLRMGDSLLLVEYESSFPSVGSWIEISISEIDIVDTNS